MSMDDTPQTGGLEPGADPELGDINEGEQESIETQPPERQYLEVDDPDNRFTRVTVNGEEQEVPFSELQKGYSRTQDYTQKTQEAARLRQEAEYGMRIQQALVQNPEMALRILAQNHGIQFPQPQQAAPEPTPEFDDPLERQLYEERQARLALESKWEQSETDRQVERAVGGLQQTYSLTNDDVSAVLQVAYDQNLGVDAFPMIWKTIAYDRIAARVAANRDSQTATQQQAQQRQQAAAAATQLVAPSTSGGNGLTNEVDVSQRNMTPREAIELAFDQLGI